MLFLPGVWADNKLWFWLSSTRDFLFVCFLGRSVTFFSLAYFPIAIYICLYSFALSCFIRHFTMSEIIFGGRKYNQNMFYLVFIYCTFTSQIPAKKPKHMCAVPAQSAVSVSSESSCSVWSLWQMSRNVADVEEEAGTFSLDWEHDHVLHLLCWHLRPSLVQMSQNIKALSYMKFETEDAHAKRQNQNL